MSAAPQRQPEDDLDPYIWLVQRGTQGHHLWVCWITGGAQGWIDQRRGARRFTYAAAMRVVAQLSPAHRRTASVVPAPLTPAGV